MIVRLRSFYILGSLAATAKCFSLNQREAGCTALQNLLSLENTTILSSTYVYAQTNVSALGSCQTRALVSNNLCRVQFVVRTSSNSRTYAEAWLPDTWYGRFLGLGNSKLGGCIDYSNLDYGTSLHFATVGSNNGHDGLSGRVFLNNSEVIKDFAYRAVHVEAVVGKQIVEAYYKRPHDKSYFLGCSTGGRQGTQSALKYPADFDGIVAGAPATDWNTYLGWDAMLGRYVGVPHANKSASYIPPDLWNTIATEILNQCDAIDGAEDGIITEPDACEFRPETLLCNDDNTAACITRAQLGALKRIYQPLYGTNGELVYPRYDPGTEADGNAQEILSGTSTGFSYDWYRFAIFNNTAYDFSQFNSYDIALAQSINPGGISTFSGDLSHFNRRGGKLISYHGRRDQAIPSGNSKRYYNVISQTMKMPSVDSFYRLFLVPGMNHCTGGPGAYNFGQGGQSSLTTNSSSHNVLLAIVDWVEKGISPDVVVGTATDGYERVHCRYPQRSLWNGTAYGCKAADSLFMS